MILENFMKHMIKQSPTLFRGSSYEESTIPVLGYMFLCIGTGLEWHKDGYLYFPREARKMSTKPRLPKDYFDKKLWVLSVNPNDIQLVKDSLKDKYYYFSISRRFREANFVFEATKEFADELTLRFDIKRSKLSNELIDLNKKLIADGVEPLNINISYEAKSGYCKSNDGFWKEYQPYPTGRYSPLVEMINKQTDSLHQDNFKLKVIRPDWILGAITIAKYSLAYYSDINRYKTSFYYPTNMIRSCMDSYTQNPIKYQKDRERDGYTPEMTLEQWCNFCWEKNLASEIKTFKTFLEMYEKD